MSETLVARYPVRVHLVTPAIVERTVARRGVPGLLTAAEQATLDAFPVERRRRDWFAGRVAAKRALRRACRDRGSSVPDYMAIEVRNDPNGAPCFAVRDRSELTERFNISIAHTDGAAVAAVAETLASGTVGVDVEVTKSLSLELLQRVLRPAELDRFAGAGAHPSPLAIWTAKEAVMKAAHQICGALRDVEISWSSTHRLRARIVDASVPACSIRVRQQAIGAYTIALALCQ